VERVAELSADILPASLPWSWSASMVLVTMSVLNWRLTVLVLRCEPRFLPLAAALHGTVEDAADPPGQTQSGKINAFLQETLAACATATTEIARGRRRDALLVWQPRARKSVRCGSV